MELSYSNGLFHFKSNIIDNDLPSRAGFSFDKSKGHWVTPFAMVAQKVSALAGCHTKDLIKSKYQLEKCRVRMSHSVGVQFDVPTPAGKELRPYQRAGVKWVMDNNSIGLDSLIGDDMGCISGDAEISVYRAKATRIYKLRDVFNKFNGLKGKWDRDIKTYVRALCGDRFRQHEVKQVLSKGVKPVVRVTLLSGKFLDLTPDHEVMTVGFKWVEAGGLKPGDKVVVNGIDVTRYKHRDGYVYLRGIRFKDHPRSSSSGLLEHVWLAECLIGRPLHSDEEVHHINGVRDDNTITNLTVMSKSKHKKAHKTEYRFGDFTHKNGRNIITTPKLDDVASVVPNGVIDVYDIIMDDPYRNFVANGIVVHNCGKTPQAICACSMLEATSVLVICPASLKINWMREWAAWSTLNLTVGIASGKKVPGTDVVIINYDILTANSEFIKSRTWDVLILDEVQYIKNPKTLRTREVVGGRLQRKVNGNIKYITKKPIVAKRKIALTGTPLPNKVIEMFMVLNYLLPAGFPNQFNYAKRYCSAFRDPFGRWNFDGASNLEELQHKLRSTIMIRRLKPDVLTDLPPKVRQVIELELEGNSKKFLVRDNDLWSRIKGAINIEDDSKLSEVEYREVIKVMGGGVTVGFEDISTVRKEAGLEILPMAISHIRDAIEASGKVVCFCWHQEVAEALGEAFKKESVTLVGSTPLAQRQKAVDAFQTNDKVKLFIGNIKAAGVGLTLTASSHVVFVEHDYVPANITQAADRCHRYGQKDSVLVQHLVLAGSIAARMMKIIIKKQEVADKALDSERDEELTSLLS